MTGVCFCVYKQVDGCGIGNPLSPTLANTFMCKLEEDVVTPHVHNLPFYDRHVEDCCTKRKTNAPAKLNSYHLNIKFTVEENPDHFLDTTFNQQEGNFTTRVYQKTGKFTSTLEISYYSRCLTSSKKNSHQLENRSQSSNNHSSKQHTPRNWKVRPVIHDFENRKSDETIMDSCPLVR